MPAAEQHHVAERDEPARVARVAAVEHHAGGDRQAVVIEAFRERAAHLIVERKVEGIRADDDQAAVRLPVRAQVVQEGVAAIQHAGQIHALGHMVVAGAAGHQKKHGITRFQNQFENHYIAVWRGCKYARKSGNSRKTERSCRKFSGFLYSRNSRMIKWVCQSAIFSTIYRSDHHEQCSSRIHGPYHHP